MRKIIIIFSVFVGLLHADEVADYYYQMGYKQGQEDIYYKAYSKGLADAFSAIKTWKGTINSYEAGKILFKQGNISAPLVFKEVQPDGSLKIIVKGCELTSQQSLADILSNYSKFDLPTVGNSDTSSKSNKTSSQDTKTKGVDLLNRDQSTTPEIQSIQNKFAKTYLYVNKKELDRSVLETQNFMFSDSGQYYKVEFSNLSERDVFCKNFPTIRNCDGK